MNNKLTSTAKKISTIFLSIVLVTGTIALASSQSSFMVGANAQAQPYYGGGGMDNRYDDRKSYGMDSYGSSNYGNDNSYDDRKSYGMDSYGSSNYGNDNSYEQSQYQQPSYKPDYKPQYQSYDKEDNKKDKFQKDIKNIDINKLKCINNNININGNNTGNINIGNKGKVGAEGEGYSGAYSSDSGSGYGGGEEYDNKQDKGFDCIINNNNTNTNIGGGGNQTIPPDDGDQRTTLNVTKTVECVEENGNSGFAPSIQQATNEPTTCAELEAIATPGSFSIQVTGNNPVPNSFFGSTIGTQVQIGAGGYTVTETPSAAVAALLNAPNSNITLTTTFEEGCAPTGSGTIVAGVPETCNIINTFTIEEDTCDECFAELSATLQTAINTFLNTTGAIPVSTTVTIPAEVNNIVDLCLFLDGLTVPLALTDAQIQALIAAFLGAIPGPVPIGAEAELEALVDCLIGAGVIIVIPPPTCDECFAELSVEVQNTINLLLNATGPITLPAPINYTIPATVTNITQLCAHLELNPIPITDAQISILVQAFVGLIGAGSETIAQALVDCLIEAGVINVQTGGATLPFDVLGGGTQDSSIIAQGTQDSSELTAVEKMTKLKQQWLSLLP